MNKAEQDALRERMGELAALEADHEDRVALERELDGKDQWAADHWQTLLDENDALRRGLSESEVPRQLEQRLLDLARPHVAGSVPKARWPWAVAVAAAVLLCIMLAFSQHRHHKRLLTVAQLALDNHVKHQYDHGLTIVTEDRDLVALDLADEIPFEVVVPDLGKRLTLVGGRRCKLDDKVVVLTLWQEGQAEYSLFQFRPQGFGLSENLARKTVKASTADGANDCVIWTEGSNGYVLVGGPG